MFFLILEFDFERLILLVFVVGMVVVEYIIVFVVVLFVNMVESLGRVILLLLVKFEFILLDVEFVLLLFLFDVFIIIVLFLWRVIVGNLYEILFELLLDFDCEFLGIFWIMIGGGDFLLKFVFILVNWIFWFCNIFRLGIFFGVFFCGFVLYCIILWWLLFWFLFLKCWCFLVCGWNVCCCIWFFCVWWYGILIWFCFFIFNVSFCCCLIGWLWGGGGGWKWFFLIGWCLWIGWCIDCCWFCWCFWSCFNKFLFWRVCISVVIKSWVGFIGLVGLVLVFFFWFIFLVVFWIGCCFCGIFLFFVFVKVGGCLCLFELVVFWIEGIFVGCIWELWLFIGSFVEKGEILKCWKLFLVVCIFVEVVGLVVGSLLLDYGFVWGVCVGFGICLKLFFFNCLLCCVCWNDLCFKGFLVVVIGMFCCLFFELCWWFCWFVVNLMDDFFCCNSFNNFVSGLFVCCEVGWLKWGFFVVVVVVILWCIGIFLLFWLDCEFDWCVLIFILVFYFCKWFKWSVVVWVVVVGWIYLLVLGCVFWFLLKLGIGCRVGIVCLLWWFIFWWCGVVFVVV